MKIRENDEYDKKTIPITYRNLWSLPATTVMVSCVGRSGAANIITIAACGIASSSPPLISLAMGVNQFSLKLIKETEDFVVNLPSDEQVYIADLCGSVSGMQVNKFSEFGLTPGRSFRVKSPYIVECPLNYECTLWKTVDCVSHKLLLGKIELVHVDNKVLDLSEDRIDPTKINPFISFQQQYWNLGKMVGIWHRVSQNASRIHKC